jgi:hypothetical protein
MIRFPVGTLPVIGDDVDHPGRHARLDEQAGHEQGRERRQLVRLQDDSVAGNHCRRHLARNKRRRIVPGDDADNHADWNALNPDLFVAYVGRKDLPFDAAREFGEIVEELGGAANFGARLGDRLALLLDDDARERVGVAAQERRDALHHLRAFERRHPAPSALGPPSGRECPLCVGDVRFGHAGDHPAGCRADDVAPLGSGEHLAVDKHAPVATA